MFCIPLYFVIKIYFKQDDGFEIPVKSPTDLDAVFDFASIVPDDESGLHDGRELYVAVPFVLPLELIQQCLIGGLREARIGNRGDQFMEKWRLHLLLIVEEKKKVRILPKNQNPDTLV